MEKENQHLNLIKKNAMEIKYDKIGDNYNLTRKPHVFLTQKMLQHLSPIKSEIYLDIGCETGNYTKEFQKKGFNFMSIEPSEKMLEKTNVDNSYLGVSIGFTIRGGKNYK